MAALTADVHIPHLGPSPDKLSFPATGADTFFAGALVWLDISNNTGQVQVASIADGDIIAGICAKQVTTTAAGDLVELYINGTWALAVGSMVATDIGSAVVSDISGTITDNEADLVAAVDITIGAGDVLVGLSKAINTEETTRIWTELNLGWRYSATLGWVEPI